MFGLGGWGDESSSHDEAIDNELDDAEADPFVSAPFADHTDRRPDPPLINGRRPDVVLQDEFTGRTTLVEKETHPESTHSKNQAEDLREGAQAMGAGFDLDVVGEQDFDPFEF